MDLVLGFDPVNPPPPVLMECPFGCGSVIHKEMVSLHMQEGRGRERQRRKQRRSRKLKDGTHEGSSS